MTTSTADPWLVLRNVSVQFPGALACDQVMLAIRPGEIIGLAGKNGAGKSTLIKVLAGVNLPTAGDTLIDGAQTIIGSTRQANSLGLSFVHQDIHDVPTMSVAENIFLGVGYPRRGKFLVEWKRLNESARTLLDQLGADSIDPRALVGELTVAEQRLVTIARALAQDARLVVLDEPTASLTDAEVIHLHHIMRRLRDHGVAVVFVTHRLDEMLDLSDRIVVMRDGAIVADRPRHSIDATELVQLVTGHETNTATRRRRRTNDGTSTAAGRPVLQVESLVREPRVQGIDMTLHQGEILGIAGLCGSGRTELLNLLFGIEKPTAGTITVGDRVQTLKTPRAAMRTGIALLPEDRRVAGTIQDLSIRTNITLASLPRHRHVRRFPVPNAAGERRAAHFLMRSLGLKAASDQQSVRTLSGGNQQKVVLAKWLDRGANIYLFDEPTHGVDIDAKDEIYQQMDRLANQGAALIFVSSDFSELVGTCDRVAVMRDGRIVSEFLGDDITEGSLVKECYNKPQPIRSRT